MTTIKDLKFDDKNFNKHTQRGMGLLEKSLQKFGAGRSILIDKDDNIIAGNGIVEAAGSIGLEKVKVVEATGDEIIAVKRTDVALDSEQGREMALADNATASADLEWDKDTLGEFFEPEDVEQWGVELDWDADKEIEEDEAPEVDESEPAKSELGKVYRLGEHRLMCGDSTDAGSVAILMDGEKADMVFTDPPYNVSYSDKNTALNAIGRGNRIQTPIKGDSATSDEEAGENLWKPAFSNMRQNSAPHCSIYCTMPQGGAHMMMMMASASWQVKHELIWLKNNIVLGRCDYNYKHEPILFGWADTHKFYGKGKFMQSVWEIPKPQKSDLHPTMKPIELIVNALENSSKSGDIIMDLFGGSGSTLIACEQLGRKCYMMELDPHYCDVIRKRWWKFTQGTEEGWEEGTPEI